MSLSTGMTAALDVTRRLHPSCLSRTVLGLIQLMPSLGTEIVLRVDLPLDLKFDNESGGYFIACEFNREQNSHRSPISNNYFPSLNTKTPFSPPGYLRTLEIEYNKYFDAYRETYYGGGVSSVYLWPLSIDNGFAAAFAIRKQIGGDDTGNGLVWNSIHLVEVGQLTSSVLYKITSSVILSGKVNSSSNFPSDVGISLNKTMEQQCKLSDKSSSSMPNHIIVIGTMIEDIERLLHKNITSLLLPKTQEICCSLRRLQEYNVSDTETVSSEIRKEIERRNLGLT